ncbi:MAG TPA: zinc-binding dehydrogenase [Candidatus Acidoferrales bacterium]|jgi:NADPH2:quinone reductase|nr:zinc-binding dehydrogenase [Candidatus Acidoferrales bacterium]
MIALQYAQTGEPADVVAATDVAKPEPKAGEVRLRLRSSPIHNHDLATIRGRYGVKPPLPAIGGSELVATVDALGDGVTTLNVGQRVAGMVPNAWAEYSIAPAAMLAPIPDAIEDGAAAQLLAMPLSALVLVDELHVKSGDWIVQNAAGGAVGRIVSVVAQKAGVNVINLVRRAASVEEVKSYGAKHVVDTSQEEWADRIRAIAGDAPIARIVDSVCDAQSTVLNRLLGRNGEHVIFGALAGAPLKLDPGALIFGETIVRGFWMVAWMKNATNEQRMNATMRVFALAMSGELPLPVAGTYSLREAKAALTAAEQPGRPGKVLFKGDA